MNAWDPSLLDGDRNVLPVCSNVSAIPASCRFAPRDGFLSRWMTCGACALLSKGLQLDVPGGTAAARLGAPYQPNVSGMMLLWASGWV